MWSAVVAEIEAEQQPPAAVVDNSLVANVEDNLYWHLDIQVGQKDSQVVQEDSRVVQADIPAEQEDNQVVQADIQAEQEDSRVVQEDSQN